MIKTTPSAFRLHFCVTILTTYSITVLKTIFCVTVTVLQFWKAKSQYNSNAFTDLTVGKWNWNQFPCFRSPKNMLFNTFSIYEPL